MGGGKHWGSVLAKSVQGVFKDIVAFETCPSRQNEWDSGGDYFNGGPGSSWLMLSGLPLGSSRQLLPPLHMNQGVCGNG